MSTTKPQVNELPKKQEDVVKTTTENPVQEKPETGHAPAAEPMVPLSEVRKLIAEEMEKQNALNPTPAPQTIPVYIDKKLTNDDDIPELRDFETKDRVYVLVNGTKPPSHGIRVRHKGTLSPLQYFNPETNKQHSLRYSTNHTSFLMDKQEGSAMTPHISIKNGILMVPKEESNLQRFLHIHPDKDKIWSELDPTKVNKKLIAEEDTLFEAQQLVRQLKYTTLEAVARVICSTFDDTWTTDEVKAQVYMEVKKDPVRFTKIAKDDSIVIKGDVKTAVKRGIISYTNFKYISDKGDILLEVPRHEDELDAFVKWTETNKGATFYQYIKGQL